MHLPKLGHVTTITIYHDGTVADEIGNVETVKAVELPPHGNLKDADKLKDSTKDVRLEKPLRNNAKQVIELGDVFAHFIDDAPTVVPASERK